MKKQYINFLKIISIIMVICIHVISRSWNRYDINTNEFKILTFIDCLCRYCVPIFVMCSGAIFLNRNDSVKKIIFKYMLKIYIIFIIFNTIYQIVDIIMYKDTILNLNTIFDCILNSILLKSIYHLWYLKIVLIIYAFIPIFRYFISKNKRYIDNIILIILMLLIQVLPIVIDNINFLNIINLFGYLLYFYIGYYIDKYSSKKKLILFSILSIISFIYMYLSTINSNIKTENYMNYLSISVLIISSFIFLFARIKYNSFEKEKIKRLLNFQVKYNFSIYIIHGFVIGGLQYLKLIDIYEYKNIFFIILYVVIVYIICFIISFIFYKLLDLIKGRIKNET